MIVVDVETTGMDPNRCAVVNIGAVDLDNPENRFYEECCVPEEAEFQEFVVEYCGVTEEEVKSKLRKDQKEVFNLFEKWLETVEDHTIGGQNIRFDINFLDMMRERIGKTLPFGHRFIDMHTICYYHMKKRGLEVPLKNGMTDLNTDKVMNYVGIPCEPKPHKKAITGAIYEAEAFSRLFYGKNLLEEFKEYPVPEYLK